MPKFYQFDSEGNIRATLSMTDDVLERKGSPSVDDGYCLRYDGELSFPIYIDGKIYQRILTEDGLEIDHTKEPIEL